MQNVRKFSDAERTGLQEKLYHQLHPRAEEAVSEGRSRSSSISDSQTGTRENDPQGLHSGHARAACGVEWWRTLCQTQREKAAQALDDPYSSNCGKFFYFFVVAMILFSTLCAVLATVEDIEEVHKSLFHILEEVFTAVFTVEIVVRMWVAVSWHSYFTNGSNIIDIVATLPWYVEAMHKWWTSADKAHRWSGLTGSIRILRIARLFRVIRLAKVARNSEVVEVIWSSLCASRDGMYVLVAFVSTGTVVSATLVYAVELDVENGLFTSLPASMWWALTTITTVGYGDMVPETTWGRLIGAATMVGGTLIVTLSVAVVTSSFTEHFRTKTQQSQLKKAAKARLDRAASMTEDELVECLKIPDSIGERLSKIELELNETMNDLKRELEELNLRSPARSALDTDTYYIFLDSLTEQANSFFKAIRGLAESAASEECTSPRGSPHSMERVKSLSSLWRR